MGNSRPGLDDVRRGRRRNARSILASDGHRKCGNLCLQLLEPLVKARVLGDLHQRRLKLLSIGQRDGKETALPPSARARPACFWQPCPPDARFHLARRVRRPVGEVWGLE